MDAKIKQLTAFSLMALFVFSLTGCARLSSLKACQANNTMLQGKLDTLTTDNLKLQQDFAACGENLKICNQDYAACGESLRACDKELNRKNNEIIATKVKVIQQSKAFRDMQEAMKAEMAAKQITINELEGKLTLSMVESILFDSGKAVVKEEGVEALKKIAEVLKNTQDQEIMVAGHTDNLPIKGRLTQIYPTNWELSAARAISVVKLLQNDGVDPKLLSACGMGEFRPEADNDTPEGRAKNRRMEIILMPLRTEK